MLSIILSFCTLFVVWVAFSGFITPLFLGYGLLSCAIAVFFAHKMAVVESYKLPIYLKPSVILYFLWLCKEIIISSFDVARKMWQIDPDISPLMKTLPASQHSDIGLTIYANSITLTPGTVCMSVDVKGKSATVKVHSLTEDGMDDLSGAAMDKKVTGVTE